MILCIDIGNTRLKAAAIQTGLVVASARMDTAAADRAAVAGMLAGLVPRSTACEAVVVSSVVPGLTTAATGAAGDVCDAPVHVVSASSVLPLRIAVAAPEQVGADRLCAAAGAVRGRRVGAIVVDVGSATTVDLIVDRVYRGGLIMPGPRLALDALARHASQLPAITVAEPADLFPASFGTTTEAMRLGAGVLTVGAVIAAVRHLDDVAGKRLPTLVTGGGAPILSGRVPRGWRFSPDLTFLGMAWIGRHFLSEKQQ